MSIFLLNNLRQNISSRIKITFPKILSSYQNICAFHQIKNKLITTNQRQKFINKFENLLSSSTIKRTTSNTTGFDVNTNVTKDVILFKYDNPKFFNVLNAFAICQFIFWNYLSHFSFTTLKDAPINNHNIDDNTPWYRKINLGENKYRNTITVMCFLIGYGILATVWLFTLRSVRYLILRKGGKELCFVTYGPFNKNRIMNVPLNCISAQESRQSAKTQLPIKIKNKTLFYVLDMRGEFLNQKLFDYTAGLKRKL